MSRTRLAGIALPLLLASALTGCTETGGATTSTATTASPSALGGTSPTGSGEGAAEATISAKGTAPSSPSEEEWPAELYQADGTAYEDYLREQQGPEGFGHSLGEVAGEAWGKGVAQVDVAKREGYTYSTLVICAPNTSVTLTDSQHTVVESPTCEGGFAGPGIGSEITYRATTPNGAPVRLVVFETPAEEAPEA